MVGNGLSDAKMNDNSLVFFAYYHGLIGDSVWKTLHKHCCPNVKPEACDFVRGSQEDHTCEKNIERIQNMVWNEGLDPYNLYAECSGGAEGAKTLIYQKEMGNLTSHHIMKPFQFLPNTQRELKLLKSLHTSQVSVSPQCTNSTGMTTYLNLEEVRKALHIPDDVQKWKICSMIDYHTIYTSVFSFYKKAMDHKLRVLVYNGDVDMACNFLGDEWFVDSLHAEDPQPRRFWYYEAQDGAKQIAGFVKVFDTVTFLTVKGAGHMVPSDKPKPALDMFVKFIQGQPF